MDLDCAPGYKCRGDIDVNLPFWVGFEFGNVTVLNLPRLAHEQGLRPGHASRRIDPPADLAAWVASFPTLVVLVAPAAVTVGGVSGTQLDAQSPDDLPLGPTGLTGADDPQWFGLAAGHRDRIILLRVDGYAILITDQIGVDNTVGAAISTRSCRVSSRWSNRSSGNEAIYQAGARPRRGGCLLIRDLSPVALRIG